MTPKKRFLVDVDGVLVDFITPALQTVSRLYNRPVVVDDLPTWDLFDYVGREHEDACYAEWTQPGWCSDLKPYPGAQEGLAKLHELGEVYIVTSPITRSPTWVHERMEALKTHFNIPTKRMVFTAAKYLCTGDFLIEDHPANIAKWQAHHRTGMGLLLDQPYNRTAKVGYRMNNWKDLLSKVPDCIEAMDS